MLLNFVLLALAVGLFVFTVVEYFNNEKEQKKYKKDLETIEAKYALQIEDFKDSVEETEEKAKEIIEEEKNRSRIVSMITAHGPEDADFINRIADLSKKEDVKFVFDVVHRSIYESAIAATEDAMILNAIGKGKGVRLIEKMMQTPSRLFGMEPVEAEDEFA